MPFYQEKDAYQKTILSELQGVWINLRNSVAEQPGFTNWERMLFHIDEAMSWENVRNLKEMRNVFLVIRNIAVQSTIPEQVTEAIELVEFYMNDVFEAIAEGKLNSSV